MSVFRKVVKHDGGATAIEYGLIAAGVAVAISAAVFTVGTDVSSLFSRTTETLDGATEPTGVGQSLSNLTWAELQETLVSLPANEAARFARTAQRQIDRGREDFPRSALQENLNEVDRLMAQDGDLSSEDKQRLETASETAEVYKWVLQQNDLTP